jgi:hypothetical protein
MINIPNTNKQWKQANNSDLQGNISVTKNINFDNEGYLRLSNSSRAAMHSSINADFDNPAAFIYNNDLSAYVIPTWDLMFQVGTDILADYPVGVGGSGTVPSTDIETDVVWFNNKMVVSQDTDVDYYDASTNAWVDTNISLTSDGQHPMVNFLSQQALAIANVNTVGLYASPFSATPTLITTLTIPAEFEITSVCYLNQNLYIGTKNIQGEHAFMFVWNGSGSAAQQAYEVDSNTIFSMCVHKGSIVLLDGTGELLRFNGGGFTFLDAFPIYYTDMSLADFANVDMYKNIMKSNGDVLYILLSNDNNSTAKLINQPDGVWCYDDNVGLYHKYSLTNSLVKIEAISTASVDVDTNIITVATPAVATGTEAIYSNSGTVIGGLISGTKYFVIKVDATHIKVATTKVNALAGTAIDLTTKGEVGQKFIFFPNVDYGTFFANRTMALYSIGNPASGVTKYGSDVMWGGEVSLRTLSGDDGFMGTTSNFVEARGYFITPRVFSNEITDNFNLLTLKYSRLNNELDKIIIKYRTVEDFLDKDKIINSPQWGITWTSTTTFTTTQTKWADAVVGDEIEVLKGAAGGLLAHITQIVNNSGTYTVTIDETFEQYITGDVSYAIFRNWTKFAVIDSTGNGYLSQEIGANGKFIQVKVELRGLGVQIEEMKVDNKYLLPAKN